MHDGKPCGRPVYDRENCVCHSKMQNKDIELFQKELDKIFADKEAEYYDLTQFYFPKEGNKLPSVYDKYVYFTGALFGGGLKLSDLREELYSEKLDEWLHTESEQSYTYSVVFLAQADFSSTRFEGEAIFTDLLFKGTANFNSAVFVGNAGFRLAQFQDNAIFESTIFQGDVYFYHTIFSGIASFEQATFTGCSDFRCGFEKNASFRWVKFCNDCQFILTIFNEFADFMCAEFLGDTIIDCIFEGDSCFVSVVFSGPMVIVSAFLGHSDFSECKINGTDTFLIDGDGKSNNIVFRSRADFVDMRVQKPENVRFRKLSLENCAFLETDVSRFEFINVQWARKGRRKAVYDELAPDREWYDWKKFEDSDPENEQKVVSGPEPQKYQFPLIAQLYRRLQKNYINNYRYSEAGDFYIGEQEMMRKAKGSGWKVWRRVFCTNFLYKYISYYGESFLLPFFWMQAVLFLSPLYLIHDGIMKAGYWDAFWKNLSFVTFNRADISKYVTEPYQQGIVIIESLLLVVLVTFFILALRRQYKRKTF